MLLWVYVVPLAAPTCHISRMKIHHLYMEEEKPIYPIK